MFIQSEATSDPARLKFLPGCEVLAEGTLDLRDKAEATVSPLAERLFAMPEIAGVSFGRDAIIITKAGGDWQYLKPAILGAIMEHFVSGTPLLRESTVGHDPLSASRSTDEVLYPFTDALRRVIDPELGYNVVDLGLVYDIILGEGGMVSVTMTTTTPGCPATDYLTQGVRDAVSVLPGVEFVEVQLTYQPLWTPEMMSFEARAHLGIRDGGRW